MRGRIPADHDYDGWVAQLAVSHRRPEAKAHLRLAGPPAVDALRRGMQHPKPMVRRLCTSILDRLLDDDTVPVLVAALDDADPDVRRRALHALACDQCKEGACRPGEELWVPKALALLRDEDPDLRAGAIDALGKVAPRRSDVRDALRDAAEHDPDRGLRGLARRHAGSGR